MEPNIDLIRLAFAEDATAEARATGAAACRALVSILEPPVTPASTPRLDPAQLASIATTIRSVPMEQLLDLAIAKLRSISPHDTAPKAPTFTIPFIEVPRHVR